MNRVRQQYHGEHWTASDWNEISIDSASTASQAYAPMPAPLDHLHEATYSIRPMQGSTQSPEQDGMCSIHLLDDPILLPIA